MDRPLRILHLADSHIGSQLRARPRRPEDWHRGDDIVRSYGRILERAREFDVDLILHAGDVFDEPDPSDAVIAAAATPLLALASDGFPIMIIPGNHERSVLPGSLLLSHPNIHIFGMAETKVLTLRGRRVAVAGIPCIRRHSAARFASAFEETRWPAAKADLNILLTHQAFDSSTCGPANFRFRKGNADVVDRAAIPREFHYVAAGHIHRQQVLNARDEEELAFDGRDVPIVYSGSVDRITFAEQDEPKGCMLLEETALGLSHRFIEHPVRAMARLPLDVSGLSQSAIRAAVVAWAQKQPKGAVSQVRLSGRTTPTEMRGLRLSGFVLEARPDLLVSVSSQSVVFEAQRMQSDRQIARNNSDNEHRSSSFPRSSRSPFDALVETQSKRVSCEPASVKLLPACPATYALYDRDGRLLYVGKAGNVRSRIRQHLSARPSGAFFEGWTRDIARIEARLAHSEIEALMVEAELIRIHRPPFNRQMRQWERYCYLVESGAYGQLVIVRDLPLSDERLNSPVSTYGPYRSRWEAAAIAEAVARQMSLAYCEDLTLPAKLRRARQVSSRGNGPLLTVASNLCQRYFDRVCSGPCAGRVSDEDYSRRRAARRALLMGEDDTSFAKFERDLESLVDQPKDLSELEKAALRFVQTLRHAFETGRMIAEARELLGATIAMPAPAGESLHVTIADETLRFIRNASPAQRPEEHHQHARGSIAAAAAIPKARLDLLATLIRHRRKEKELMEAIVENTRELQAQ